MKAWMLILPLFALSSAQAEVLPQDNHTKTLFSSNYAGYYVKSVVERKFNTIRLESCSSLPPKQCKTFVEMKYDDFSKLSEPTLNMLRDFRAEIVKEKDSSLLRFISGGSEESRDVEAIDLMIREIENRGLEEWVLLRREWTGDDNSNFSSPDYARELESRMKKVLARIPLVNPRACQIQAK